MPIAAPALQILGNPLAWNAHLIESDRTGEPDSTELIHQRFPPHPRPPFAKINE